MDKNLNMQIEEALKVYFVSRLEDQVDYKENISNR